MAAATRLLHELKKHNSAERLLHSTAQQHSSPKLPQPGQAQEHVRPSTCQAKALPTPTSSALSIWKLHRYLQASQPASTHVKYELVSMNTLCSMKQYAGWWGRCEQPKPMKLSQLSMALLPAAASPTHGFFPFSHLQGEVGWPSGS